MATNASEQYLTMLAERSFLKLWTLPNPHRRAGKELADLLVAFGHDLIVFSDKASLFDSSDLALGWKRWRQRTIDESVKQLEGAARMLVNPSTLIFQDNRATRQLPFVLPEVPNRRLHLVAIARPDHDPSRTPVGWKPLTYASSASSDSVPHRVGRCFAGEHFVHVFDGESLELLLEQMDTASDFICYLKSREQALRAREQLYFSESDLLAIATKAWTQNCGFTVELPDPDIDGVTDVPKDLWATYVHSNSATRTRELNSKSRIIDRLIDHFHTEYDAGRMFRSPPHSYNEHESAMRILGGESRFGRRVIATALNDILEEMDTSTFWASTVPSKDVSGVRYVWLTYPQPPANTPLEEVENIILSQLRQHLYVARLTFQADLIVGIAVPNRNNSALSYIICMLDGSSWTEDDREKAEQYRSLGIFECLQETQHLHIP